MKKSTKNKIENNLKSELYDFMKKYGNYRNQFWKSS